MVKQNNLKLATVKKISKQMDETEIHVIEEGLYKGEQITFHVLFDEKSIEELSAEFGQMFNEANEKGIELSQNMQIYLINMLTIKHFTHFKFSLPSTLLGEGKKAGMLEMLEHFHKTGLLSECLNKMFLPSETAKILDKMTDFAARGLMSIDLDKQMVEKFESLKLRNKDVFEQLGKINTENKPVQ